MSWKIVTEGIKSTIKGDIYHSTVSYKGQFCYSSDISNSEKDAYRRGRNFIRDIVNGLKPKEKIEDKLIEMGLI